MTDELYKGVCGVSTWMHLMDLGETQRIGGRRWIEVFVWV